MKAVKIVLVVGIALLVLLVTAVVVVSLPGVQQAIVTRLVATEPGQSLEMEHFRIGLNRTEARGVHFQQPDASYQIGDFSADLSVFDLIFRRQLRMGDVVATGLVIDVSELEPTEELPDDEPFEGILRQMELPRSLYMDTVRLEGTLLLPAVGDEPVRSDFVVTGGGFAPEREGALTLVGDLRAPGGIALMAGLAIEGEVTVLQGRGGRIERARLVAQLTARGTEREQDERLRAEVLLLAIDGGEEYQASFDRILTNQEAEADEQPDLSTLVFLDATFLQEKGLLTGRWAVEVDREQLAAFVEGVELPQFSAVGRGEFSYGIVTEALALNGELRLSVDDLGRVAEELQELGGFVLNSRFNLGMDDQAFRLDELVLTLRDRDDTDLLQARNFQPIFYNRQVEQLEGVEEGLDLAEFTIHGLPVEWANLFLSAEEDAPAMTLRGGDLTGQLLVSAENDRIRFRLVEPLQAVEVAVLSGDEVLFSDISFELEGSGSFENGQFRVNIEPLRIFHQQELTASGSGTFDSETNRAEANLQANLARLLDQPVLQDFNNLAGGMAELEMAVVMGGGMEITLNGTLRDLITRDEREELARVTFEAVAREIEENLWEIDIPIRLEGSEASDLRIAGRLSLGEDLNQFALNVTGEQLVVDHFTGLASAFSALENDGVPDPTPANERDQEPVWSGFEGRVMVEMARIQLQAENGMEELRGDFRVNADSVESSLQATFLDSPVQVGARVRFLDEEDRPYVLDGLVEAPRLAAGELFRQLQPQRPPTVEGLFVVSVEIVGTGRNLADLADRMRFQARLRSGGGVIRLLYSQNPLAELGFAAGALFGGLGRDAAAVGEIAQRLRNMPYDELNLQAERDEELNFILRDLTVLSPEMHLRGSGQVQHRENVPVLEQPMNIRLRLSADGPLKQLLGRARVLGEQEDELGYRQMRRDFAIRGTAAAPDASAFYQMIVDALLRFVAPRNNDENDEERPIIPQIPDIFDRLLKGIR